MLLVLKPLECCFLLTECETLEDYYQYLECDCFDIARRRIGGKYFDIFCDDVGLFHDDPTVSAVDKDGHPMLVGNLIIANHDEMGEATGLSDDDIILICSNVVAYEKNGERVLAIICDY